MLVYAYNADAREHVRAREWWERTLTQSRPVGMPWITALGFIRISTHRSILNAPMFPKDAIRTVDTECSHVPQRRDPHGPRMAGRSAGADTHAWRPPR